MKSHHGINLTLASIWTEKSTGVGEFLDLIPLIDWARKHKMDVVQLLPLNESGRDPSPYNARSSNALHPIYLSLHALPGGHEIPSAPRSDRVHYHDVYQLKMAYLREYLKQNPIGEKLEEFRKEHRWLDTYALFKTLKAKQGHKHWKDWEEKYRDISNHAKKKYLEEFAQEILFYESVQYLCFDQMKRVKAHAEVQGVMLKGDIPILVNPDSADVWGNREFFDLELEAGSAPSPYDPEGQHWGFPLYRWDVMEQNHFEWWKVRLKTAEELYHLYRLDHIVGFFRIWAIPPGKKPSAGKFVPENDALAEAQGRKLLELLIAHSKMVPIGEDLGTVPPYVRKWMDALKICGTKILRWEDNPKTFPSLSMSSVSTHDIEPLRLSGTPESELLATLKASHRSGSLYHIDLLQEYLSTVPELRWEDPEQDRINVPGKVLPTNWTSRTKDPLEVILNNQELSKNITEIVCG